EQTGFFTSSEEAAKFLTEFVAAGDLLLVKGSRGVHMEVIAETMRGKFPLAENVHGEAASAAHERHG
ncbi:MAG: hypothetical protein ACREQD_04160, partial [Candidatus Binataceae bacterium]